MPRRGPNTARQAAEELERDPDWVAARRRDEAERQAREAGLRAIERPLAEDLAAVGIEVTSAWDLVNRSEPYPAALPILLDHLKRPYPDRVREGMARALAVRGDARFAWNEIKDLFVDEEPGTDAKDGLAVALTAICDKAVVNELADLARDSRHGRSRIFFIRAFRRLRQRDLLDELADDPELATEIRRLRRRDQ